MRAFTALIVALMLASCCVADDSIPAKHSRVHVVFVTDVAPSMMHRGGMELIGGVDGMGPMARIGNVTLPAKAINPIRITIDGDFVGHALVGSWDIKPVFILPEGKRKFTFVLSGIEPVEAELTVLGTGSTQYLVVRLPTDAEPLDNFVPADDTTIDSAPDKKP